MATTKIPVDRPGFLSTMLIAVAAVLLATGMAGAASDRTAPPRPFGPVEIRSQSPLQQLRFGLLHHRPWVTSKGDLCVYVTDTWKNIWLYDDEFYRIDAEIHDFGVRGCYGLGRGFELAGEVPLRYVSGGFLDGLIENFHDWFGIGNAGREKYPRNDFAFEINPTGEPEDWSRANDGQRGWSLGNLVLSLTYELPYDSVRSARASITASVKLPTGTRTEFFGGQSLDYGLSLTVSRRFGPVYLYVSPGMVYYFDEEVLGIQLYRWHFSGLAALEYHRAGSSHSWFLQMLMESGIAEDYAEFSDNTYELLLGCKFRLSDSMVAEIGFLENVFFFNNSPDIGLHFGVIRRLQL